MSYPDVGTIWTSEDGNERIVLAYEEGSSVPYDDGSTPILRLGTYSRGYLVEQVRDRTSYEVDEDIIVALRRCAELVNGWAIFERYLRIFHGATSVKWYDNGYTYVTFDTADWRERVGLTDGYIKAHFDRPVADMDEWIAYCEGGVYWARLERLVTWQRRDNHDETRQDWETLDAIGGLYGYEWAVEGAKEYLQPVASSASV